MYNCYMVVGEILFQKALVHTCTYLVLSAGFSVLLADPPSAPTGGSRSPREVSDAVNWSLCTMSLERLIMDLRVLLWVNTLPRPQAWWQMHRRHTQNVNVSQFNFTTIKEIYQNILKFKHTFTKVISMKEARQFQKMFVTPKLFSRN